MTEPRTFRLAAFAREQVASVRDRDIDVGDLAYRLAAVGFALMLVLMALRS